MKITATNEYTFSNKRNTYADSIRDWYENKTEKYLVFELDNKEKMESAYNAIYALTKRRGNMNINRCKDGNKVVVIRR